MKRIRAAGVLATAFVALSPMGGCPDSGQTSNTTVGGVSIDSTAGGNASVESTNGSNEGPNESPIEGGSGTVPGGSGQSPTLGGLQVFPPDSPWNQDITALAVHPNSAALIASIGLETGLHPDFGTFWEGGPIGFPYIVIGPDETRWPVSFEYEDESDPGPYPIPLDAPIEGGSDSQGDRHVIAIDPESRRLYELYAAYPGESGWEAGSGAIWDLDSSALRPEGWTSADAAGLPIFPGLVRYDEVEAGEINHALRFTVSRSRRAYIHPATHFASSRTDENLPPMGMRVRLRADFDVSSFPSRVQVILRAMQKHGMLVADNGSNWYVSGAHDSRWDDEELATLRRVKGRDFEVVHTGEAVTE